MGFTKREMERHESLVGLATGMAVKRGLVQRCDVHGHTHDGIPDEDGIAAACSEAEVMIEQGLVGWSLDEFKEALETAITDAGDDCYACAKIRDE